MTNYEYIRSLDTEDLAEYIYSVFICGKLLHNKNAEIVDYVEWLNSKRVDE